MKHWNSHVSIKISILQKFQTNSWSFFESKKSFSNHDEP